MAVVFDAVGPGSTGTTTQGTTLPLSVSWTHVCSGSNRAVVVAIAVGVPAAAGANGDNNLTASVTFGGTGMSSFGRRQAGNDIDGFVQFFGLVNPPAGSSTVTATVSGSTTATTTIAIATGSTSFTGVDQTTPFDTPVGATGTSGTPTVTVSSVAGNMVTDALANGSAITSSNQTQAWLRNVNSSSGAGNGASSVANGASSVTMSYVASSDYWAMIAVELNQYVAPAVPVGMAWVRA